MQNLTKCWAHFKNLCSIKKNFMINVLMLTVNIEVDVKLKSGCFFN